MNAVTSNAVTNELVDGGDWTSFASEAADAYLWFKKIGKTAFIHIDGSEINFASNGGYMHYQRSGNDVYLDTEVLPRRSYNFIVCDNSTDSAVHIRIMPDGRIKGWSNPNINITTITNWEIDICYRLD